MIIIFTFWFGFYLGMPGVGFHEPMVRDLERSCRSFSKYTRFIMEPEERVIKHKSLKFDIKMKGYQVTCVEEKGQK